MIKGNMKKIAIGLIAGWVLLQAGAEESQWLTDVLKAQAQAKRKISWSCSTSRLGLGAAGASS